MKTFIVEIETFEDNALSVQDVEIKAINLDDAQTKIQATLRDSQFISLVMQK